jgi:hypothetical protein
MLIMKEVCNSSVTVWLCDCVTVREEGEEGGGGIKSDAKWHHFPEQQLTVT